MASLQQEHFTFSNPSQNSSLNLPKLDLHSWGSKNKEIEGNKQEMLNLARYKKEDPYELSLRDIVVEFPTILNCMKESYTQGTEKRECESFDAKMKITRNNKSKSKWFLLKLLFPLPSKIEGKKQNGRISDNSSILTPKLSLTNRIENFDDFDLWEDNLFGNTSNSSSSSSASSGNNISSDDQHGHDSRKMNGCFPFLNLAREAKS